MANATDSSERELNPGQFSFDTYVFNGLPIYITQMKDQDGNLVVFVGIPTYDRDAWFSFVPNLSAARHQEIVARNPAVAALLNPGIQGNIVGHGYAASVIKAACDDDTIPFAYMRNFAGLGAGEVNIFPELHDHLRDGSNDNVEFDEGDSDDDSDDDDDSEDSDDSDDGGGKPPAAKKNKPNNNNLHGASGEMSET